jgi:hypothetical protein
MKKRAPQFKLRVELVPEPIWQFNLRSKEGLGKYRWDKYRRKLIAEGHNKCSICGSTEKLEGHEVWRYKSGSRGSIAKLVRVEIVCQKCHFIKRWGQAQRVASNAGLLALRRHFRKVNRCSQADFDRHLATSVATWKRRSANPNLEIDWGDFKPAVKEAAAARQKWSESNPQHDVDNDFYPITPGHHMPSTCKFCGAKGMLRMIAEDREEMSEGQEADYESGNWGHARCLACERLVDWGY